MIAIANESGLLLLEFIDRRGLEREVERLRNKTKSAIIPGRTKPIDLIEKELEQYFQCGQKKFNTPIVMLGSDFQKNVWHELIKIPPGETRSYADIAKAIKQPSACRAVARANGANQLAIIIPCHRVINSDGELGGYGGGLTRKAWLINHEKIG
jgi:AraC family transcriptional regulator of adaptative response/methylated-DNA-[protein]-cysteine methyltransferase